MIRVSTFAEHPRSFFVVCIAFGAAASALPFIAEPNGNVAILPYLITWFACGSVAGLVVPDRPWRWAIAMAVGPSIAGVVRDPGMILLVLVTIPLIPIVATPIVIGAYAGKIISPFRVTAAAPTEKGTGASSRLLVLFAAGGLVCAVSAFVVSQMTSALLVFWVGSGAAIAAAAVAWARSGVLWATGTAIAAVVAGFMAAVIHDTMSGASSHNLLPFELMYVMISAVVPASSAAWLTQWIVGRGRVLPHTSD